MKWDYPTCFVEATSLVLFAILTMLTGNLASGRSGNTFKKRKSATSVASFTYNGAFRYHRGANCWSGRQDLNLRPPVPKTGALPTALLPAHESKYIRF